MKRLLAMVLTVCMVMAFIPCVSFAADTTINAVRSAYFNSNAKEWKENDGDNLLISSGASGWTGATSFTDNDGTVTTQASVSGSTFGSARNAVVAFTIPADFDPDNTAKVTLSVKVKNIKQTTAGARLSVYGNSIDGTWSVSDSTSIFGVNGSTSGLADLELLGLMDAITVGNSSGESTSNQVVTLSSQKLTEYVKAMAKEGKSEVTFRLACSAMGGIRIYDAKTSTPPTLTIEEGKVTTVKIKTVYMDGETVVSSSETTVGGIVAGTTYDYTETPEGAKTVDGVIYTYSAEESTLSTAAKADGTGEIVLVYNKYDESQTFTGYEVDDEGAWCWFADPRAISYANEEGTLDFTIIGYIDVHGDIKATQINNLTEEVNEVLIRTNLQPDDHNNPTFLVLPDERIIVFYSRHTDEKCFWYRVTKKPGDLTTLSEEKCLRTEAKTTYPSPFLLSDDPDHIYLTWRGIEWHPTMAQISMPDENGDIEFTWGPNQVIRSTAQSSGCRPYAKYTSNGKDTIHITYTATHPDNVNPNSIYYTAVKITDFTEGNVKVSLQGADGSTLTTSLPYVVNNTETNKAFVVDPRSTSQRGWVWQIALDDDNQPVIAMVRINGDKSSHDYYYAKWNGSEWVKTFLSNGGGKFHQGNTEYCYSGGLAIDPDNPRVIYGSVPVEGAFGKVYEIIKYTMNEDGTQVASTEALTKNSLKNNARPYVIGNSEGKNHRVTWMNGEYYDWMINSTRPLGYCTRIMIDNPLPEKTVNLNNAVSKEDYSTIDGAFASTKEIANIVDAEIEGSFTVAADIYLDGSYEGKFLNLGDVELGVKTVNTMYGPDMNANRPRVYLKVNGTEYLTSNVYCNSDSWANYARSTGGQYYTENYEGYINHIITYDGSYLTLYREGHMDYKLPVENLTLENVEVGGFDGLADNVYVFDRVLNRDEIRTLADVNAEVETPDADSDVKVTKKYVDAVTGEEIDTATVTLPAGTEKYSFVPEEEIEVNNSTYTYASHTGTGTSYTVYYTMTQKLGENLAPSLSDLTRASDGAKLDTWEIVDKSTLDSSLTGQYIHRTGSNTGGAGTNTMRTFVPIEGGKSYYVSNTAYYNAASGTASSMNAIIASGDALFGSFADLVLYSDVDYGGVTGWVSEVTWKGTTSKRNDIKFAAGVETKVEYIINTPAEAKNIMISYGAHGNNELYYGDFVVREIIDVETVDVTVDGNAKKTYGELTLGTESVLPENVIGYHVTSGENTTFVGAGEIEVSNGDEINTAYINVEMVTGAQVRYGGGLDKDGKVSQGNGLRFIAQVDRSSIGSEVIGYGMRITAEGSTQASDIAAKEWQDGDSQTIFTVAITDLATSNYNRNFTAAPYVKVKYADGSEGTIYGTETITRSIYQVAAGLLKNRNSTAVEDEDNDYSVESKPGLYNVLNAYVNMVGIRLTMNDNGVFVAREEGAGAYSGDIFFDVTSEKVSDGVYTVTITPLTSFENKVTIMSYWNEFVRINNNHSKVVNGITNSSVSEDGTLTFTFTPANAK